MATPPATRTRSQRTPDAADPPSRVSASRAWVLLLSILALALATSCDRVEEKVGRMGDTASRQVGRTVTDNMDRADNALDEPFERVQEAADERMTELGDDVDYAARGAIEGGLEGAENAVRGAAGAVRFESVGASDEFDSQWADKPGGE